MLADKLKEGGIELEQVSMGDHAEPAFGAKVYSQKDYLHAEHWFTGDSQPGAAVNRRGVYLGGGIAAIKTEQGAV